MLPKSNSGQSAPKKTEDIDMQEAPNSFNFFVTTPGGRDGQLTVRRESFTDLLEAVIQGEQALDAAGFGKVVRRGGSTGASGSVGQSGGKLSSDGKYEFDEYRALELIVTHPANERKGTQALWAVNGAGYETEDPDLPGVTTTKFPEYPIRVWKEPLEKLGIDLESLPEDSAPYNISQFQATYMKEVATGKIKKVVKLEPAYRYYDIELGRELTVEEERAREITPFEEMKVKD